MNTISSTAIDSEIDSVLDGEDDGETAEDTASGSESAKEKKNRIGGRVRALGQATEALDAVLAAETEKNQGQMVRQSAVTAALQTVRAALVALSTPKVRVPRDGVARTLKPYFVGWQADGKRLAFTAPPAGVEFSKVTGPYSSRNNAMTVVDFGMTPEELNALKASKTA